MAKMSKGPQGLSKREQELMDALGRLHAQFNQMADEEARSVLVRGWAAKGGLLAAKAENLRQTEKLVNELMGNKTPAPPKSTKLPRKLPEDPIARGVAIMREATEKQAKPR